MESTPEPRFFCDVMLGGLARWLRAAGYDAEWREHIADPDLVRLALERSSTALQAVDVITDLVSRHGPGVGGTDLDEGDPVMMLADGKEAYLLAACSTYWAVQEVREVRVVRVLVGGRIAYEAQLMVDNPLAIALEHELAS